MVREVCHPYWHAGLIPDEPAPGSYFCAFVKYVTVSGTLLVFILEAIAIVSGGIGLFATVELMLQPQMAGWRDTPERLVF